MSTLAVDGITNGDGSGAPAFPNGVSGNIITTGNLTAANLTLSGGAYLGGTGSANLLDDYEEGTFTPSIYGLTSAGTTTYNNDLWGNYTKIGNMATVWLLIDIASVTGSGQLIVSGLPFASPDDPNSFAVGPVMCHYLDWPVAGSPVFYQIRNTTLGKIYISQDNGAWNAVSLSTARMYLTLTYRTV